MRPHDPFAPVPLSRRDRPIVVQRDRRGVSVEDHIAGASSAGKVSPDRLKLRLGLVLLMVSFSVVAARVAYLQVAQGSDYRTAAERNRTRLEIVQAPRGVIFDRTGQPMLVNVPNFTLVATPADLPRTKAERQTIVDRLAATFPPLQSTETVESILNAPVGSIQPIILAEYVPYADALRIETVVSQLPGISLETVATRSYTSGRSTAHLIGYLGKPSQSELTNDQTLTTLSSIGRMGVEQQYDELLRGTDGIREVERDHLNKELNIIGIREPVPGQNLKLAIDQGLQSVLSEALRDTVDRLEVPGGAAVAIDPRNGEVLALVSEPAFDPNLFTTGGSEEEFAQIFSDDRRPLFFRPISGTYPSGSTIKPLIASAALSERVITDSTTVSSVGGIRIGSSFFPDWQAGGHGTTDVRKALAESVNTFFYMIGGGYQDFPGLGVEKIVEYMSRFGLGDQLGIDLPNEAKGFIPTPEWRSRPGASHWFLGDTYHLSIGQGYINVTPLQIANYTAAVANGGSLYRPHVLREVLNPDGTVAETVEPSLIRNVADPNALATVRSGMRQAVLSGSARALGSLPVPAAAKTGTAQFGEGDRTHAWLTSFAPYDRPEIVITVVVEQGGEGHAEALPIARAGLAWYFSRPDATP